LKNADRGFIPALESARGIAALAVCAFHCMLFWSGFRQPATGVFAEFLQPLLTGAGNSAVTFFFILSGFVLAASLNKMELDGRGNTPLRFTVSRIFRIYPAVFVVIFAVAMIEPDYVFHGEQARPWGAIWEHALLFRSRMVWPTWSARVEVAATPLIIAAWYLRNRFGWRALAVLASILALISFAARSFTEDPIPQNLFVFVLGMLLLDSRALFHGLKPNAALLLFFAALFVDLQGRTMIGWHDQWTIITEAACCFLIVGLIAYAAISTRWLETPFLRFFGRISYSFYLIHFAVLFVLLRIIPDPLIDAVSFGSSNLAIVEVFLVVSMVATALSAVLYYCVERPWIAFGRSIISSGSLALPRDTIAAIRPPG
jgi:exopolysaccharide production protein ExoZ